MYAPAQPYVFPPSARNDERLALRAYRMAPPPPPTAVPVHVDPTGWTHIGPIAAYKDAPYPPYEPAYLPANADARAIAETAVFRQDRSTNDMLGFAYPVHHLRSLAVADDARGRSLSLAPGAEREARSRPRVAEPRLARPLPRAPITASTPQVKRDASTARRSLSMWYATEVVRTLLEPGHYRRDVDVDQRGEGRYESDFRRVGVDCGAAWGRMGMPTPALLSPQLRDSSLERFDPYFVVPRHRSAVDPAFVDFVDSLIQRLSMDFGTVAAALWYIRRLALHAGDGPQGRALRARVHAFIGHDGLAERAVAVVGLLLASKWVDDHTFTNKSWHEVSGFNPVDIHALELAALQELGFTLFIPLQAWIEHCSSSLGSLELVQSVYYTEAFKDRFREACVQAYAVVYDIPTAKRDVPLLDKITLEFPNDDRDLVGSAFILQCDCPFNACTSPCTSSRSVLREKIVAKWAADGVPSSGSGTPALATSRLVSDVDDEDYAEYDGAQPFPRLREHRASDASIVSVERVMREPSLPALVDTSSPICAPADAGYDSPIDFGPCPDCSFGVEGDSTEYAIETDDEDEYIVKRPVDWWTCSADYDVASQRKVAAPVPSVMQLPDAYYVDQVEYEPGFFIQYARSDMPF
ncbi:hypothetical protein Q5752_003536 [Cryptotrichosporon argae]